MQELFYTPDQSDLFFGYECEMRAYTDTPWAKVALDLTHFTGELGCDLDVGLADIRTPFLTREAIEAEGWECWNYKNKMLYDNSDAVSEYRRAGYWLLIEEYKHVVSIKKCPDDTLFYGYCPSLNEFRKLCKMVGIEKKADTVNVGDHTIELVENPVLPEDGLFVRRKL